MISCLITLWTRKPELASNCTESSATCIRQRDVEKRPSPCPCSTPSSRVANVLCWDHSNRSINNDHHHHHPANRGSGRFSCRNPLGPNTINSCRMIWPRFHPITSLVQWSLLFHELSSHRPEPRTTSRCAAFTQTTYVHDKVCSILGFCVTSTWPNERHICSQVFHFWPLYSVPRMPSASDLWSAILHDFVARIKASIFADDSCHDTSSAGSSRT